MSVQTPIGLSRPLTSDEVRAELAKVSFAPGGAMQRAAGALAGRVGTDSRDLLHEAVRRALVSRVCPAGVPVEQFVAGIMRSIVSAILRSRERGRDIDLLMPTDELEARLGLGGYTVRSPEEVIEIRRVRQLCIDVLDRLAEGSTAQEMLVDAIGHDLRGQQLADHLGVTMRELATLRRALKRRVQRIWPEVMGEIEGETWCRTNAYHCRAHTR